MKQVAGSFGGLYAGILVQHVQPITPANEGDMSSDTVPSHHLFSIQIQAVIHLLQYFDIWTTFSRIFLSLALIAQNRQGGAGRRLAQRNVSCNARLLLLMVGVYFVYRRAKTGIPRLLLYKFECLFWLSFVCERQIQENWSKIMATFSQDQLLLETKKLHETLVYTSLGHYMNSIQTQTSKLDWFLGLNQGEGRRPSPENWSSIFDRFWHRENVCLSHLHVLGCCGLHFQLWSCCWCSNVFRKSPRSHAQVGFRAHIFSCFRTAKGCPPTLDEHGFFLLWLFAWFAHNHCGGRIIQSRRWVQQVAKAQSPKGETDCFKHFCKLFVMFGWVKLRPVVDRGLNGLNGLNGCVFRAKPSDCQEESTEPVGVTFEFVRLVWVQQIPRQDTVALPFTEFSFWKRERNRLRTKNRLHQLAQSCWQKLQHRISMIHQWWRIGFGIRVLSWREVENR